MSEATGCGDAQSGEFLAQRERMVASQLQARGISDRRVLDAMLRVPRHEFVPGPHREQAYEDHPLPIGEAQTISQPYIVASMLEALQLRGTEKVLEIGTGSGYVTALMSELAAYVYSVERHADLAVRARELLTKLGYWNFEIVVGDGSQGLPQYEPFNAIIVSAAAATLPPLLLSQLADGGRMIIPVGATETQQLQLIRTENGQVKISLREPCRFVPLIAD